MFIRANRLMRDSFQPPSQRNAIGFWHSDGSVKSIWHSFGTVGGEIGQIEKQSLGKSFIIFAYFMSGRSAAW